MTEFVLKGQKKVVTQTGNGHFVLSAGQNIKIL